MTAFIEKIRANLLTEDDVLREAWLFQLKDYPLVPVELTNELVAFCRTHEAARKKLLLDGENFPKDEHTIELLLEWMHELPLDLVRFVPHFLRNTPAKIIAKYAEQLVSFVGKDFIAFYEQFLPFEAGEAGLMELWEPLDDLLHDMMARFDPMLFEQAKVVQDMLIQTGEYGTEEVQETIEIETEDEYGYGGFSENGILAVRAVGVMQLHQYIPTLVKLLERQGEDLLIDEAAEALIRLQSDDVVKAVAPNILDPEQFIEVISVLKDIKTPLAERVLVEAYEQTNEVEIQEFLLDALIAHFSEQAFPFIEQFIENDEYSGIFDMEELFYSFYKAMNREHPLLEEWKHEVMERNQQFEEEMKQLLLKTAIQEEFGKVGRNDPCVCGSGKKFKKCCGK